MSRNDDYRTGNLLDFLYHQNYYKLFGIDLSRQKNPSIPQNINLSEKIKIYDAATVFFIAEKQKENYAKVFFRFINFSRIT